MSSVVLTLSFVHHGQKMALAEQLRLDPGAEDGGRAGLGGSYAHDRHT